MRVLHRWGPASRLTFGLLAASLAVAGLAGFEAWRLDPLPAVEPSGVPRLQPTAVPPRARFAADSLVLTAVSRHPFRPDRRRPPERYRLPGQRPPASTDRVVPPEFARMRLLGTAVLPRGGLATVELSGRRQRVLRTGQDLHGFRLLRVERGLAVFEGTDTTIVLRLPEPGRERSR